MMSEYKDALHPIEYEIEMRQMRRFESTPLSDKQLSAIKHALLIADALEKEPSEGMVDGKARDILLMDRITREGAKHTVIIGIWKAMVAKMKEEIGEEG